MNTRGSLIAASPPQSIMEELELDNKNRRHKENIKYAWEKQLIKRFPILSWLPKYARTDLTADLIAGITVGLTVVPQSMAYAAIAGLSPEVISTFSTMICNINLFIHSSMTMQNILATVCFSF